MNKTISLQIPLGYIIDEKSEFVKVWTAEKILTSKRSARYTRAVRQGEDAILYSSWLICPHCGERFLANVNSPVFVKRNYAEKPSKKQISRWASLQTSLFDSQKDDQILLAPSVKFHGKFVCPHCENESYESTSTRQILLIQDNKKLTVKCEVLQLDEILSIGWVKEKEVRLCFPVFEIVTFDFQKGRVYARVENPEGEILCQRDVSSHPDLLCGGAVHKVLTRNKLALRTVKRLFEEMWQSHLPFCWKQTDLSALYKMTTFIGYPKSFYDCIPYMKDSFIVDDGFADKAKQMHFSDNLNQMYRNSGMPQVKSIRRIMFLNPGLFFYIDEIKGFWESICDYNLLSRFLLGDRVYDKLSAIHLRPGILCYMRDYARIKGGVDLINNIEKRWRCLQKDAVDYCCMSQRMRLDVQKQWKTKIDEQELPRSEKVYSLPMHKPEEGVVDCVVDGFSFVWLRNSNDYATASKHLKNCLGEWESYNSPVVGVRKKGKYVAAIEVYKGYVVQARVFDNRPLESVPEIDKAVGKWMLRFGLKQEHRDDIIDLNAPPDFYRLEEMPF